MSTPHDNVTTTPGIEQAARECAERCHAALIADKSWADVHVLTPIILAAMRGVVGDVARQRDKLGNNLREFARSLAANWDCDTGANGTHPRYCRKCEAEAWVKRLEQQPLSPAPDGTIPAQQVHQAEGGTFVLQNVTVRKNESDEPCPDCGCYGAHEKDCPTAIIELRQRGVLPPAEPAQPARIGCDVGDVPGEGPTAERERREIEQAVAKLERDLDEPARKPVDKYAGHTPGPWGIEQTEGTNWIGPMRKSGDGKVGEIVTSNDRLDLHPEALARNDANARLIAAAPALLNIVQWILNAMEKHGCKRTQADDETHIFGWMHVLFAARRDVKMYVECNARVGKENAALLADNAALREQLEDNSAPDAVLRWVQELRARIDAMRLECLNQNANFAADFANLNAECERLRKELADASKTVGQITHDAQLGHGQKGGAS